MKPPGRSTLVLLAILSLAGALRFYGLETQSLWVDELASVQYSDPENARGVIRETRSDVHPPGYYLILNLSRDLLGDGEWALRFPSAAAGFLSVLGMYLLGRRLYSAREGLVAALFTAVFFAPVHYSQEARSYSLLLLFSILTAYFWWGVMKGLRGPSGRAPWTEAVGYASSAVVCCYLHYFGLILVALQGVALLLLAPRAVRTTVLLYLPVAVAYLPWLPVVEAQTRDRPPGAPSFTQYLGFLFNHSKDLQLLVAAVFGLSLLGAWGAVRKADKTRDPDPLLPSGMLVAWFIGTFAVTCLVAEYHTPILTVRNLIVALPAAYLLLARAVTRIPAGEGARFVAAFGLATLFLAHLLFSMGYYTEPRKQQIREAVAFVVENAGPDTLVVHCGVGPSAGYYYEMRGTPRDALDHLGACGPRRMDAIRERVREGGHRRLILVHAHLKPRKALLDALAEEFDPVRRESLVGAGARLYEVGPRSES